MKNVLDMKDLSDSREVMMSKAPMSILLFIYIMLGVIASAIIWASFGQIDEYSKASGEIRPNESAGTLSAGSGGKIAKINYKDGDIVTVGDVIIEFDAASIFEQKASYEKLVGDEKDKIDKYNKLKQSVELDENLFSRSSDEEFFYYQYENYVTSLNQQIEQIKQSNDKLSATEKELELSISTTKKNISTMSSLQNDYNNLYNAVSAGNAYTGSNSQLKVSYNDYKINYDKAELIYNSYKAVYENLVRQKNQNSTLSTPPTTITQEEIDQAKFQMDNAEKDMSSVTSKFLVSINSIVEDLKSQLTAQRSQLEAYELQLNNIKEDNSETSIREKAKSDIYLSINTAIDACNSKITEYNNQLINIDDSAENRVITSQTSGTLVFSQDLIAGDNVNAGTQIGRIIPKGNQLKITLYIPGKDIASIKPGLSVEYILNSVSISEYGKSSGKIISVSADSFSDEASGQKFYKAEATIDKTVLTNKKGETRTLQTGMVVEASVIIGTQSILSWTLDRLNLSD
jgi:HlyD family secretion protein